MYKKLFAELSFLN